MTSRALTADRPRVPTANMPRGIRNNNPGNIRIGIKWKGLAAHRDMADFQQKETEFCVFTTPTMGIRAMARILRTYQRRHGLKTVQGIIHRWAPPIENDSDAYVEHVAEKMRIGQNTPFDFSTEEDRALILLETIIFHENGLQPYGKQTIREGYALGIA